MTPTTDAVQFLLNEHQELRNEILKRTEIQHQLISITLVAFGALISVGLQGSATALLAYPILALFLSAAWSSNDIQIAQLGAYIRDQIEEKLLDPGMGWEHRISSEGISRLIGFRALLATRGLFWGSEVLAVALYLVTISSEVLSLDDLPTAFSTADVVLLVLALLATAFTFVILRRQKPAEYLRRGDSA